MSERAVGIKTEAEQGIFSHIQMVVSLIEGYQVLLETIKSLVGKLLRQHRIDLGKNLLYPCREPP
jgi:hypothetical protein